MKIPLFEITSDAPWHISCAIEQVGRDYLCHVHAGDWHVGAVALSQWRLDRAETQCLTVDTHKESDIAVRAARQLCSATRRSVVCVAGIHFDGVTRNEIEDISRTADEFTTLAAMRLGDQCAESSS